MKANRKFLLGEDEAVSPVIAVILMVAITVVLAATVYVWVSGFGSQSSQPAKTLSLTSAGSIDSTTYATDFVKTYTVASATSGMRYQDITVTMNGVTQAFEDDGRSIDANAAWGAYAGATDRVATDVIAAGDTLAVRTDTTPAGVTLRILDAQANSVILTLTVG